MAEHGPLAGRPQPLQSCGLELGETRDAVDADTELEQMNGHANLFVSARGDLDLHLHTRVAKGTDHRGIGRTDVAEMLAEDWRDPFEIRLIGQIDANPNDISEIRAGLAQRRGDIAKDLFRLFDDILGNRSRRIVEPRRAGDKNPGAIDHSSRIAGEGLERRPRTDMSARHLPPHRRCRRQPIAGHSLRPPANPPRLLVPFASPVKPVSPTPVSKSHADSRYFAHKFII